MSKRAAVTVRPHIVPAMWLVLVFGAALAGCGSDSAAPGRYCNYGSTSKAQYDGCMEHVTADEINRSYDRNRGAGIYAIECDLTPGDYSGPDDMPECAAAP